jgi:hypothetical protein
MIETKAALLALSAVLIAGPAFGDADCKYKGTTYRHGSAVCQSGSQYRCQRGRWNRVGITGVGIACTENPPVAAKDCAFNGNSNSPGSASCQSGTQYRCDDGAWMSLAVACTGDADVAARMASEGRTCMYHSATVATRSTICKSGITFRCDDGEWRNLGSACQ